MKKYQVRRPGYYEELYPIFNGIRGLNAKRSFSAPFKKKKGGKNTALVIILTISYEKPRPKID